MSAQMKQAMKVATDAGWDIDGADHTFFRWFRVQSRAHYGAYALVCDGNTVYISTGDRLSHDEAEQAVYECAQLASLLGADVR